MQLGQRRPCCSQGSSSTSGQAASEATFYLFLPWDAAETWLKGFRRSRWALHKCLLQCWWCVQKPRELGASGFPVLAARAVVSPLHPSTLPFLQVMETCTRTALFTWGPQSYSGRGQEAKRTRDEKKIRHSTEVTAPRPDTDLYGHEK